MGEVRVIEKVIDMFRMWGWVIFFFLELLWYLGMVIRINNELSIVWV